MRTFYALTDWDTPRARAVLAAKVVAAPGLAEAAPQHGCGGVDDEGALRGVVNSGYNPVSFSPQLTSDDRALVRAPFAPLGALHRKLKP